MRLADPLRKQAWQCGWLSPSLLTVIGFLRFVGIVSAAVWFGSTFFYTLVAGPAFFSEDMRRLLGGAFPAYSDPLSMVLLGRYYVLQQVCGAIALFHLLVEWLYTGKAFPRMLTYALMAVFAVGLLGGYAVQPKMKQWHAVKYVKGYTPEQRKQAENSFALLRGFVHVTNALATITLMIYVWRLHNPPDAPRFGKKR